MDKIGQIGLQPNTFRLGNRNVGKHLNMNECASQIITVNFGGTFAMMNEGQTLLLTIVMLMGITLILNGCAEIFIRIL